MQYFLKKLKDSPISITFPEVMDVIAEHYHYTPTSFTNGLGESSVNNEAGANEGSCKLFAFAKIHNLTEEETLHCFGDYYRKDVLENPEGLDHSNIRNFIQYGWEGITFSGQALTPKTA